MTDPAWGIRGFKTTGDCPKVPLRTGKGQNRLLCGKCLAFAVERIQRGEIVDYFCWCCGALKSLNILGECPSPRAEAMLIEYPLTKRERPKVSA